MLLLLQCNCSPLLMHCAVPLELFHLSLPQVFVVKRPMGSYSKVRCTIRFGLREKHLTLCLWSLLTKEGSAPVVNLLPFFLPLQDNNSVPVTNASVQKMLCIYSTICLQPCQELLLPIVALPTSLHCRYTT